MWSTRRRDPRIRDEIAFHRDRLIDDYVAGGMDRQEAERRAFLEFGNPAQIEESVRDVRGRWLEDLARDLRYAARTLSRSRGFTAAALLSLALGIGANTAMFSLINAVMLRTLPVKEPERLVQVTRLMPDGRPGALSYPPVRVFSRQCEISFRLLRAGEQRPVDHHRWRGRVRDARRWCRVRTTPSSASSPRPAVC